MFSSSHDAVAFYHDLLVGPYGESTPALLEEAIQKNKLTFGGRSTCTVLRPCFLPFQTYRLIEDSANAVMAGISAVAAHLFKNPALRKELALNELEEQIVQMDTGYGAADVSARLDGFLGDNGEFQFVEYNADSPGGLGFGDVLADVFRSLPIMSEFSSRYRSRCFPVRELVLNHLLAAYQRWGGHDSPQIAIIDWKDASTYNEFLIMQHHFRSKGYSVKIADPSELEIRNNALWIDNFRVNLIYKRLLVGELLSKYGLNHPLIHAVQRNSVCVVNGFAVQMLFKKTLFALLSDPLYADLVPSKIREAYQNFVPWTRKVQESKTSNHGKTIDLLPFVADHRNNFVLKPNSEYGGKGVVLGWETTPENWDATLRRALEESYIVQERVSVGKELYPRVEKHKLIFEERFFDVDPYVWNGSRAEGSGVRLSSQALLNVSAGGGSAVPLFVLEPK